MDQLPLYRPFVTNSTEEHAPDVNQWSLNTVLSRGQFVYNKPSSLKETVLGRVLYLTADLQTLYVWVSLISNTLTPATLLSPSPSSLPSSRGPIHCSRYISHTHPAVEPVPSSLCLYCVAIGRAVSVLQLVRDIFGSYSSLCPDWHRGTQSVLVE